MRKVVLIGAGTVGTSVTYLLQKKDWLIAAVASRTDKSLKRARGYLKANLFTLDVAEAACQGELVFIATRDDVIQQVTEKIASEKGFREGQFVFHFSGALSTQALKSVRLSGASVGSIHPMQTFADIDVAIGLIPGTVFGVTADKKAIAVAREVVEALGGKVVEIEDEDKALYHAAACIACNYLVALMNTAVIFYRHLGIEEKKAWEAMKPLIEGTLSNIESKGTVEALTGPIARGDVETVRGHLKAIKEVFPELTFFYKEMGKITAELAHRKGLTEEAYLKLKKIFSREGC